MKKINRTICILLSFIFAVCLLGCSNGVEKNPIITKKETPQTVATLKVENLEEGTMPILGFGSVYSGNYVKDGYVYPSIFNKQSFAKIKDAGVNLIIDGGGENLANYETSDNLKNMLEYGDELDLHFILPDKNIFSMNQINGIDYTISSDAEISERLKFYDSHKSISGLYVRDEPTKTFFPAITKANNAMKTASASAKKNYITYNNMFPPTNTSQLLGEAPMPDGGYNYSKYIDDMAASNPTFLMYDSYPFEGEEGNISNGWFATMSMVRQKAAINNLPWLPWIQAGGNFADAKHLRVNTEGEFLWAINSALAFGAKGVGYFPLTMPNYYVSGGTGSFEASILNEYGNATPYHAYAKKQNKQISAIDNVLMNASSQGMIFTGKGSIADPSNGKIQDGKFRQLKSVSGDSSIVGCFDYLGGTALYVVNNDTTNTLCKVDLEFDNNYYYDVVQRGVLASVSGTTLNLKLDAGEGVLVLLR